MRNRSHKRESAEQRFGRPRIIETLARVPVIKRPVLSAHNAWLSYSCRNLWHWNNRKAIKEFADATPQLDSVQNRILSDLSSTGIAVSSFPELLAATHSWDSLERLVVQWLQSPLVRSQEAVYLNELCTSAHFKEYIIAWYQNRALIPWECTLLQLGYSLRILEIVNTYFAMFSRLHHVNLWNTVASDHSGPNIGPQRWHRDPDDRKLVKVFLYLSDVSEADGPLQYVPHSREHEQFGKLWPQDLPFDGARPPADQFDALIPSSHWTTCTGSVGTIVLADTAGFHRGGRSTGKNRVVATWAYSSPASLWPCKFRVSAVDTPHTLTAAQRAAVFPMRA